jgi:hypothetical protein
LKHLPDNSLILSKIFEDYFHQLRNYIGAKFSQAFWQELTQLQVNLIKKRKENDKISMKKELIWEMKDFEAYLMIKYVRFMIYLRYIQNLLKSLLIHFLSTNSKTE